MKCSLAARLQQFLKCRLWQIGVIQKQERKRKLITVGGNGQIDTTKTRIIPHLQDMKLYARLACVCFCVIIL